MPAYAASQTTMLHMKRLNQTESPIFVILCVLCFQMQSFLLLLYSTVAVLCCMAAVKVSPYIIIVQVIFYFIWDHWAHPVYFENRTPLKPVLGRRGWGGGGGVGGGGGGAFAASQTTVLHMLHTVNQIESPISVIFCVLSKGNPFFLLFHKQ